MNLHPLLVHFPIAFLTLYAVFELIPVKKLQAWSVWFYVKAILVIIGSVASGLTYFSGEAIEREFAQGTLKPLIELHSQMAAGTVIVFAAIAFLYFVFFLQKEVLRGTWNQKQGWMKCVVVVENIMNSWIIRVLALIGFIFVTLTGALGGGIVHGPQVDPFVGFVFRVFGLE